MFHSATQASPLFELVQTELVACNDVLKLRAGIQVYALRCCVVGVWMLLDE
jgi:hypothetical protein